MLRVLKEHDRQKLKKLVYGSNNGYERPIAVAEKPGPAESRKTQTATLEEMRERDRLVRVELLNEQADIDFDEDPAVFQRNIMRRLGMEVNPDSNKEKLIATIGKQILAEKFRDIKSADDDYADDKFETDQSPLGRAKSEGRAG